MKLDARQRAMLREMGVQVWWPTPRTAAAGAPAQDAPAKPAQTPERPPTREDRAQLPTAPPEAQEPAAAWQIGPPQVLQRGRAEHPRWLLLAEQRDGSAGPADALLQAMLKAAGLHRAGSVWLAPMHKQVASATVRGLEHALEQTQPDVVFIMGRWVAQALLESPALLGQLRGQVHDLWGLPAVVSYDCAALLRNPSDKAKAWDDLCLALQVAAEHRQGRLDSGPAH
ncbi:MAG: uracil-DNA glycosylase family protein [Betaproteobacteria bacterium]